DLQVEVRDAYLDRFKLIDDPINALQDQGNALLNEIRAIKERATLEQVRQACQQLIGLRPSVVEQETIAKQEFTRIEPSLPRRREQLRELVVRPEIVTDDLDADTFTPEELDRRVERLRGNIARIEKELAANWNRTDCLLEDLDDEDVDVQKSRDRLE